MEKQETDLRGGSRAAGSWADFSQTQAGLRVGGTAPRGRHGAGGDGGCGQGCQSLCWRHTGRGQGSGLGGGAGRGEGPTGRTCPGHGGT